MWQSNRLNKCQTAKIDKTKSPPQVRGWQMADPIFIAVFPVILLTGKMHKRALSIFIL